MKRDYIFHTQPPAKVADVSTYPTIIYPPKTFDVTKALRIAGALAVLAVASLLSYWSAQHVCAFSPVPEFYPLHCPDMPKQINPCLEPGIEHKFQILAHEMLEERVSLTYASAILKCPTDRLRRDELIMLCRIVSEDCRECSFQQPTKRK